MHYILNKEAAEEINYPSWFHISVIFTKFATIL